MEGDNSSSQLHSHSPSEGAEDASNLFRRLSESQGLSDVAPASPSQRSLDLDQGQHIPHLLCAY